MEGLGLFVLELGTGKVKTKCSGYVEEAEANRVGRCSCARGICVSVSRQQGWGGGGLVGGRGGVRVCVCTDGRSPPVGAQGSTRG